MADPARERWYALITVVISLAVALLIVENGLLVMEWLAHREFLDYPDTKNPPSKLQEGGILKKNLDILVTDGLGGKVRWRTNAQGFRNDREFNGPPPPGVLRVLSLGDSFTAGYRVGQEETYSYLLEQWLNQTNGKTEVLVSLIEEPVTGLYYLTRFGVKFQPHLVLLGLTLGNDIASAYVSLDPQGQFLLTIKNGKVSIDLNPHKPWRGLKDLEGAQLPPEYKMPNGSWEERLGRFWTWLRKHRIVRLLSRKEAIMSTEDKPEMVKLFDILNGLGMYMNPPLQEIEEAYHRLFWVLRGYQVFCQQHGMIFAVVLFPQRFQVQPPDWQATVEKYRLNRHRFDLMAPNRNILAFCREAGIACIDPTEAMAARYRETGQTLYLRRGDMHWNKDGQLAVFEALRAPLAQLVEPARQRLVKRQVQGSP